MATSDFFEGKRPWSRIKDRILGQYMSPYIAKVNRLKKPILLIDAFAGPGRFNDGSPGSPLIMCQAAAKFAPYNYKAVFINIEQEYHSTLEEILKGGGWYPRAKAILGDSMEFLKTVRDQLTEEWSIFLYLDPFGLDCDFEVLKPFLERNPEYSTEILINLNAGGLHRLAGSKKVKQRPDDPVLLANHARLTNVLGGDYWKPILLDDDSTVTAKTKEHRVVEGYMKRLSSTGYLAYTGACPIQATRSSATKYYMIFASRHPDSMVLFNDHMLKAFEQYMTESEFQDTLFADMEWTEWRDTGRLPDLVVDYVTRYPGLTRENLWPMIVRENFMKYSKGEYGKAVNQAFIEGRIQTPTPHPRPKQLNENCVLYPT